MLPLAPARELQHHDVRRHAGLGHVQYDEDMNLEDMLPLGQAFNLDQDDAMLEDDNNQLREQVMSPREHGQQQQGMQCKIGHKHSTHTGRAGRRTPKTRTEGIP